MQAILLGSIIHNSSGEASVYIKNARGATTDAFKAEQERNSWKQKSQATKGAFNHWNANKETKETKKPSDIDNRELVSGKRAITIIYNEFTLEMRIIIPPIAIIGVLLVLYYYPVIAMRRIMELCSEGAIHFT